MGKSVLITGAGGFVGSCLARRLLKENYEVHIVLRRNSSLWRLHDILEDIHIHYGDLMNDDYISNLSSDIKVDLVCHLAAYGLYHYQADVDDMINTNIIGTWNLFREFSKKDIEMFVNTGSSSEYGEKLQPMSEDMKLEPNNMYGASKASADILCSTYAKINKLPLVTMRLFSPYGYYDAPTRLIPSVISSCLLGKEIKLSQKNSKRDFIFIDDVTEAYMAAGRLKGAYGEVLNIGSGREYTIEEVSSTILRLLEQDVQIKWEHDPQRQCEPERWVSDNKKACRLLNWKPRIKLEEGLKRTIGWFRDNIEYYRQVIMP